MNNKKVLIISVVAVIVLVITIITTSYAVFTANLTGTKNNKLNTGYVTLNCTETNFTLNNTSIMTDAEGIAANNNSATCTLTSTMNGTMRIGYDIALNDVTPSANMTTQNVKMQVKKKVGSAAETVVRGTTTTGVTVASLQPNTGTYDTDITAYNLDSGIITGNQSTLYTIKSWLASGGNGVATTSSDTDVCSDITYTTEAECKAAGQIWGDRQSSTSSGGTFSFKIKLGATQVLSNNN